MTAEEVGVAANWVLTIMSLLGVIWISAVRITTLQVKVDTIWSFLMKRALSEALVQGVATSAIAQFALLTKLNSG